MSETPAVAKSKSSTLGLLGLRAIGTAVEVGAVSFALSIAHTLYESFLPTVKAIGAQVKASGIQGFTEGWNEGMKEGLLAGPTGMAFTATVGRIASNLVAGGIEALYGRKLSTKEKWVCETIGAFVAVGLQVSATGGGVAILPALGYYATTAALTSIASYLVTTPLKSLASYSRKALDSNPTPAPATA